MLRAGLGFPGCSPARGFLGMASWEEDGRGNVILKNNCSETHIRCVMFLVALSRFPDIGGPFLVLIGVAILFSVFLAQ